MKEKDMQRFCLLPIFCVAAFAFADVGDEEFIRQQQRQEQLHKQLQPQTDVRSEETSDQPVEPVLLITGEQPCFPVHEVDLDGEDAARFRFALHRALRQLQFSPGSCLGRTGINQIMSAAQNAVIGAGYTTTRILAAPQEISSGRLIFTVIAGKVGRIYFDESHPEASRVGRINRVINEIPLKSGDILNLRRIEQALENLKRVPTAEADIQIIPAEAPNESDVLIQWAQREVPFRVTLTADDSGSRSSGKYQGSATLSADNPLGLSDLFYFSYSHDILGGKDELRGEEGKSSGGTEGYTVHYSVPMQNWLLSLSHGSNRYRQAVAGYAQVYEYSGSSRTLDLRLTRQLYRDARRKISAGVGLWWRRSRNFIDEAEIDVQRRATGGWIAAVDYKAYMGDAVLDLGLSYKRGTGAFNAKPAPEELFNEGTHRFKVINADVLFSYPFRLGTQSFSYQNQTRIQWNRTPLTTIDQFSIGSRYTVRGFDEKMTLMAERGWVVRNDFSWHYTPAHQLYVGADMGHVSGYSAKYLLGKTLIGAAVGLRGQINVPGQLHYDLSVGTPLKKPKYFQTNGRNANFSLSYSF